MSVSVSIDVQGLGAVFTVLGGMANMESHELLDGLGRLGVSQTRRRLSSEKTTPAGRAWPANQAGTSILFKSGGLSDSIAHYVGASDVRWGSGHVAARVHQFGAIIYPKTAKMLSFMIGGRRVFAKHVIIPRRTYLGMSVANEDEMQKVAEAFIGKYMK